MEIVTTNFASLVKLPPKEDSNIHQPFSADELKILWQNTNDFCIKNMRGGIKTAAGINRIIPIAEKILPFISEFYDPQNEYLIEKDKKIIYQNFRQRYWNKSKYLNSLPTKHLPHDGRHTCATLMDDAEIPLKIRQLILGHSSQDITNRVYTHKTIQQLIDAINQI